MRLTLLNFVKVSHARKRKVLISNGQKKQWRRNLVRMAAGWINGSTGDMWKNQISSETMASPTWW
jgi:hypothetical protein